MKQWMQRKAGLRRKMGPCQQTLAANRENYQHQNRASFLFIKKDMAAQACIIDKRNPHKMQTITVVL